MGLRMVARKDIDTVDIREVLAITNLIEVSWSELGPSQSRFRLLWTHQTFYVGADFTGKRMEEALSCSSAAITIMRRIAIKWCLIFGHFVMPVDGMLFVITNRL